MSRLRVPVSDLHPGRLELCTRAAHYVVHVHRLGVGDAFVVFDPQARVEADASLVEVGRGHLVCEIGVVRPATLVAQREAWLVQGIAKHDTLDQIVRDATELGVSHIVPGVCRRANTSGAHISPHRMRRWIRIAEEAARQCGRGDLPNLEPQQALLDGLRRVPERALKLCLCAQAQTPACKVMQSSEIVDAVAVLVGPEGGLDSSEVDLALDAGFVPVSLGPYVLRVETAATAILGALLAWHCPGV